MPWPAVADLARVPSVRLPEEPSCPQIPDGHRPVYLIDAATGLEDRLLRGWISRCHYGASVLDVAPSRLRRPGRRTDPGVGEILGATEPLWVVPVRVVWMPAERHGRRSVSWFDVLKLGDPRDPRWFRDYLVLARHPDRVRIVVGEAASGADLARDWAAADGSPVAGGFVARRARLALDRAERAERGNRYKIARFVAEDIVSQSRFRDEAVRLGRARGLGEKSALARARYYLAEMAATHSPFLIDLIANIIHSVIRQGYGAINYDRAMVERIAHLGRDHPLVFLPSHKSNLDRLSLQFMLWENDLPPNHTAGGINMNFFPVGPLVRRTGVFFIRRSFKGNDLYKFVLRTYIDYLLEKRFPLEWYMEGGRSRSGKLRPPRYGMLSWVVDSHRRGKAEDVYLLPISIAYDQIQEVGAYVTEATGGGKEKETLAWALKFARSLRRRYGDIHIRFAEPISVSAALADADLADEDPVEVQKLAFEVMYRMSRATPVTPTALVSTVLLAAKGNALGADAIAAECARLVVFIDGENIPVTGPLPVDTPAATATIGLMAEHGLVSSHAGGGRTVHWMEGNQKLRASYYANTIVHYFVPRGLIEIALGATDVEAFWSDLLDLRDLLKFEFFFADKDAFRRMAEEDLDEGSPDWETRVANGRGDLATLTPSTASWAVLPILDGYQIVADELAGWEGDFEEERFLTACLKRGRRYLLERKIVSDESVSQVLFAGAVLVAANRGLTAEGPFVQERRARFATDVARYAAAAAARN